MFLQGKKVQNLQMCEEIIYHVFLSMAAVDLVKDNFLFLYTRIVKKT